MLKCEIEIFSKSHVSAREEITGFLFKQTDNKISFLVKIACLFILKHKSEK